MTVQGRKPGSNSTNRTKEKMNQNKKTINFTPVQHVLPTYCRNLVALNRISFVVIGVVLGVVLGVVRVDWSSLSLVWHNLSLSQVSLARVCHVTSLSHIFSNQFVIT